MMHLTTKLTCVEFPKIGLEILGEIIDRDTKQATIKLFDNRNGYGKIHLGETGVMTELEDSFISRLAIEVAETSPEQISLRFTEEPFTIFRRKDHRINWDTEVLIIEKGKDSSGSRSLKVRSTNISAGGISVNIAGKHSISDDVEVSFSLPEIEECQAGAGNFPVPGLRLIDDNKKSRGFEIKSRAEKVFQQSTSSGGTVFGLRFLNLSGAAEQQLKLFTNPSE